jgi:hypothetical protein
LLALLAASACIAVAWPRCAGAVATFDAPWRVFSVVPGAAGIAVADLNHDDHADAIVAGQGFQVLLGQAPVGFAVQAPFGTLLAMVAVALADFDGDGDLDAVGAMRDGGAAVAFGHGDGSFDPPITISFGLGSRDVAAGDVNGDGRVDAMLADSSASAWVLLGKSNRTFRAPMAVPLGHSTLRVALGDIDGDGRLDALMQRPTESFDVLLGRGDGTFDPSLVLGSGPNFGACGIALVDLVGDARPEIVVGSTDYDRIQWNTFDPLSHTFGPPHFVGSRADNQLVARDVNGDGEIDLTSNNRVWLGAGDGSFPTYLSLPGYSYPLGRAAGDVDHDGAVDLVDLQFGAYSRAPRSVQVFPQRGGTFRHVTAIPTNAFLKEIATADLNLDGKPDVIANTSDLFIGLANGDGTFTSRQYTFDYLNRIVPADVNRDGIPDLVLASNYYSLWSTLAVWTGLGNGQFTITANTATTPVTLGLAVGEITSDVYPDVLSAADKGSGIQLYAGDASGGLTPIGSVGLGSQLGDIALADLDGDGRLDLLGADASLGAIRTRRGLGSASFGPEATAASLPDPSRFQVGDLDGDGHADLAAVSFPYVQYWSPPSSLYLFFGNGDGSFAPGPVVPLQSLAVDLRMADLDGDGTLDIAVGVDLNALAVLFNNGDRTLQNAVMFGSGYWPGVADFDGDGRLDLVTSYGDEIAIGGAVLYNRGQPLATPPARQSRPGVEIVAVRPNPFSGSARVAVTLVSDEPATLGLFDISGRRMLSRRVEGARELDLRVPASLPAGVYVLRLSQGRREASTRVCLVR